VQNTGNLVDARFLLASELVFRLHHMCMIASDTSGQAVQGHPLLGKVYQGIIESPDELAFNLARNSFDSGNVRVECQRMFV
jgi:hypothetical protein